MMHLKLSLVRTSLAAVFVTVFHTYFLSVAL